MKIISIGEILWDVFGDQEQLGGASFNFAAHTRRLGHDVVFVSAVGKDERGGRALARMRELGLATDFVQPLSDHPTGIVTVLVDAEGQPTFTIHRPAAYDFPTLAPGDWAGLTAFAPDWIYFGTLFQMAPEAKAATLKTIACCPGARRFYDINLRRDCYTPALVREMMGRATVVKLSDVEVNAVQEMFETPYVSLEEFARAYAGEFGWDAVCVTRGAHGCSLLAGGSFAEVRGYPVRVCDTVGSGDAFAAAFVHGISQGWPAEQIGDFANRVGALVASRPGGTPMWSIEECLALER